MTFFETASDDYHDGDNSEAYFLRENKGQWPDQVLFRFDGKSKILYLEEGGFRWHVMHPHDLDHIGNCKHNVQCREHGEDGWSFRQHAYNIKFSKANSNVIAKGFNPSPYYSNYFLGNDSSKWASNVKDYSEAQLNNVYDHIDLRFYRNSDGLKYDWIVHPKANVREIVLEYTHLDQLYIKHGNLYQVNSIDTIIEDAPYAYQIINGRKREIEAAYVLKKNNKVSFELGEYDKDQTLIIDPRLIFSTYTGSTSDNWGSTATPGKDGSFYAGGVSFGVGYPVFDGSYNGTYQLGNSADSLGITDITISKFSSDGTNMLYSTYLGGEQSEFVHSIIENSRGELVIFGTTSSEDYPLTDNAYQSEFGGGNRLSGAAINNINYRNGSDIILTVLTENGTDLMGSTYVGGSSNDGLNDRNLLAHNYGDQFRGEVIVDELDNIYVASCTQSDDFPTSSNPSAILGGQDACVFSLNRECSNLRYSRVFGGTDNEAAYSLKRNSAGNIIVTGGTSSVDYPLANALNRTYYGGDADGFISILDGNNLNNLLNSTYVGTDGYDQCYLVSLNERDEIYVIGQSNGDMPISQGVYANEDGGQFIHIYEEDLSSLKLATTFGTGSGEIDISITAFHVDLCERIYASGWGGFINYSNGFSPFSTTMGLDVTDDAFRDITDSNDFYFIVFERNFDSILYATYFGHLDQENEFSPDHVDGGTSRYADGSIYQALCAGCGGSDGLPTTDNAYSRINGSSNCNLGAVKFDFELEAIVASTELTLDTFGCAPYNAEFVNLSTGTNCFKWYFGDGDSSFLQSPSHLYDSIGVYQVKLIAESKLECLEPDTLDLTITIIESEHPNKYEILECEKDYVDLQSSWPGLNSVYQWEDKQYVARSRRVTESGLYSVTATESNCLFIDSFDVIITNDQVDLSDSIICGYHPFDLNLDPRATDILWSTGSTDSEIFIDEPGLFSVEYSIGDCNYYDSAFYSFASVPEVEIIGDSVICGTSPVSLRINDFSHSTLSSIEWSNGSTDQTISVVNPGDYSVTVTSDSGCVDVAVISISQIDELPELISGDSLICNESKLEVDFSDFASYSEIVWNDASTQYIRTFTNPGTYSYTISNFCETRNGKFNLAVSPFAADERPIYIPNAFTPNEDNTNDVFKPEVANEITILDYRMMVFDRWGNKVFESRDVDSGWDGTFRGEIMDPAIYAYTFEIEYFLCESPKEVILKGDVNLQK